MLLLTAASCMPQAYPLHQPVSFRPGMPRRRSEAKAKPKGKFKRSKSVHWIQPELSWLLGLETELRHTVLMNLQSATADGRQSSDMRQWVANWPVQIVLVAQHLRCGGGGRAVGSACAAVEQSRPCSMQCSFRIES